MADNPFIQLNFDRSEVPGIPESAPHTGDLKAVLSSSLTSSRMAAVTYVTAELNNTTGQVSADSLLRLFDEAWVLITPRFVANVGPLTAAAYYRAFRASAAGEVPTAYIDDLAARHAERTLGYFKETSAESLVAGFNKFVNQQMATKEAAERVAIAYGLTPRQMNGFVAASATMNPKVASITSARSKVLSYVERSLQDRFKLLSEQEDHNITQEANQIAWLWMKDKGQLSEKAKKMWITAHDEKVCPSCGPLHGKKILIAEKFKTKQGEYWVPGLHPNCRCVVRLMDIHPSLITKADDFDPKEHPRGARGRFVRDTTEYKDPTDQERAFSAAQRFLDTAKEDEAAEEVEQLSVDMSRTPTDTVDMSRGPSVNMSRSVNMDRRPLDMSRTQDRSVGMWNPKQRAVVDMGQDFISSAVNMMRSAELSQRVDSIVPGAGAEPEIQRIVDNHGKPMPVYAIVPFEKMSPDAHNVNLQHDLDFYSTSTKAGLDRLKSDISRWMGKAVDSAMDSAEEKKLEKMDSHGNQLHAHLEYEDIEPIISTIAYGYGNSADPSRVDKTLYTIVWKDADNTVREREQLTAAQLAPMLGIDQQEFMLPLARVTRGHDSSRGSTSHQAGTKYGYDEYTFSGDFHVYDSNHTPDYQDNPNIRLVEFVPDTGEPLGRAGEPDS